MAVANSSQYLEAYADRFADLSEKSDSWLKQQRTEALGQFTATGFPKARDEEWRYTQLSALDKTLFLPAQKSASCAIDVEWLKNYQLADAWSIVLVDGFFSAELSQLDGLPAGVVVSSLAQSLADPKSALLIADKFNQAVNVDENGFVAFNSAYFADGVWVHLGQDDMPASKAKKIFKGIIGVSAYNDKEIRQAIADKVDYFGFGPVFKTSTKKGLPPVKGLLRLARVARKFRELPVVAIGGINEKNISKVFKAGAVSASLITAVCSADNPEEATRKLIAKIKL